MIGHYIPATLPFEESISQPSFGLTYTDAIKTVLSKKKKIFRPGT